MNEFPLAGIKFPISSFNKEEEIKNKKKFLSPKVGSGGTISPKVPTLALSGHPTSGKASDDHATVQETMMTH